MIYQGNALEVLKKLPDESVNMCITSPPYWALRCYLPDIVKIKGGLSSEKKKDIEKELTLLGIESIIR